MRLTVGLVGLLLTAAPVALAQNQQTTTKQDQPQQTAKDDATTTNSPAKATATPQSTPQSTPSLKQQTISIPPPSSSASSTTNNNAAPTTANPVRLSALPTIAGVGIPDMKVPDTAGASFMQKSNLPDGTVFICVGAILAFFGAAVLAWRGLVAWSLHRSVKRAAVAQNLADIKAMSAVPGKKRGMYNVVGANSTMSLDHLHAAPIGNSKVAKPFAQAPGGTPPRSTSSLFFSPTAGGSAGLRDSVANRSSNYLPAGFYASGTAAPASGSSVTHVGGHGPNLSVHSLATPGNRFSARSGVSPPHSPSLPPQSRGYERAPASRDGFSNYNRNSIVAPGTPGNTRTGVYSQQENMSQLSLNVPGGTSAPGGRAPSAYLEDLFENHGTASRERL